MGKAEPDFERKEYLDERRALIEGGRLASENFDKTMLTLSGGALGLSITFLKEIIAPASPPLAVELLIAAWVCYAIVLTITLVSFRLAYTAYRRAVYALDEEYRHGHAAAPRRGERLVNFVLGLSWFSIVLFIAGTAALAAFSMINV